MSLPIGETALPNVWGTIWLYIASVVPIEGTTLVCSTQTRQPPFPTLQGCEVGGV